MNLKGKSKTTSRQGAQWGHDNRMGTQGSEGERKVSISAHGVRIDRML